MDKELRKNEFLVLTLEILNTFFITWLIIIMPFLSMVFVKEDFDPAGMGAVPLVLLLYMLVIIPICWIFLRKFRKFSNKKKKIAINMSFILDVVFAFAWLLFAGLGTRWVLVSSIYIAIWHLVSTIIIRNKFNANKELDESEKHDEKVLLDSLLGVIDLNIILGGILCMILLVFGFIDTVTIIYTFCYVVVAALSVSTLVLTIKEKKSLVTFNVIFGISSIVLGTLSSVYSIINGDENVVFEFLSIFPIVTAILGIKHLFIVKKYLKKRNEKQKVIN